ncbi:Hut operon regulatory protein HutP [Acididesulfobacillus acetoxydans]|uniref:Hut operon positive regulatory protein n=1 Tax=Acididesulfobacillus acetoxydans TaxID=1561005 RepID=A0A8S0W3V9_9FIRM|nr:HutP family protein [Acididesulfobacillus acetoxydans]CAA7602048.1 Hut operon regulatory protein HutP [Acididesulfobacillus acetoxydans]CEJ08109.1 HutP protein [Acididesulfobacillus acetoxydans]
MIAQSKRVAMAALKMAMTESREEETELKEFFARQGIKTAAVDYGGDYVSSVKKIIERAVVAAKREGVIKETHGDEGAVAGATREALTQIMPKAIGLNVGGKIGVARRDEHLTVAIFFGVGLLHLDEVAMGLGHRAAPKESL